MKRISQFSLVLLVALSIGLHWVVLQSVAWAGMFVDYAADHSLGVAIAKTFDADNKCDICKLVDAGTQDASPEQLKPQKLDVFSEDSRLILYPTEALGFALLDAQPRLPHLHENTVPPPRRG